MFAPICELKTRFSVRIAVMAMPWPRACRLGQPDDIKGLAVFLAADASAWITGALIPMDGGNLAMNAGGSPGGRREGG